MTFNRKQVNYFVYIFLLKLKAFEWVLFILLQVKYSLEKIKKQKHRVKHCEKFWGIEPPNYM